MNKRSGRRRRNVPSHTRSPAPATQARASAVHERGSGGFPPEVVQPPAGPIEAQTQPTATRSAPQDAPGTVADSPAAMVRGDRAGLALDPDANARAPTESVELDVPALDRSLRPEGRDGPQQDDGSIEGRRPERVRRRSHAESASYSGAGEQRRSRSGAAAEPETKDAGDKLAHTQLACMETGGSNAVTSNGLRSDAEPPTEPVARPGPLDGESEAELDPRTLSDISLIGHLADVFADELRAVLASGQEAASVPASGPVPASIPSVPQEPAPAGDPLGKIGSYSSTSRKQGVAETPAEGPPGGGRPQPTGTLPCPRCGPDPQAACDNGCHCTTCRGMHTVAAYTCEQCGASCVRLHHTTRRGSPGERPWLCDDCWSREVVGPSSEHVHAPGMHYRAAGVSYRPETPEDRESVRALVQRLGGGPQAMSEPKEGRNPGDTVGTCERCGRAVSELHRRRTGITGTPGPWLCGDCESHELASSVCEEPDEGAGSIMTEAGHRRAGTVPDVMPERPLAAALDRMTAWLEHHELSGDQAKLCEPLLTRLQLCSAAVMNAQLRRSWKPKDAS
jgi:hypothetical protein